MAANAMIRLTEQDYNRVRRLLAELTHQSRGMQATLQMYTTRSQFAPDVILPGTYTSSIACAPARR